MRLSGGPREYKRPLVWLNLPNRSTEKLSEMEEAAEAPSEQEAVGELLEWAVEAPGRFTFSPWKAVSGGDDDEDLAWTPELALNETDFCFGDERLLFLPQRPDFRRCGR